MFRLLDAHVQTVNHKSPLLGSKRCSLLIIFPYLFLILKANTPAALHCSTWLRFHFVVRRSMISYFLFWAVFLPEESKWKCNMWSSNKRGRKCADLLQKSGVAEEWRVFTQGFLIMYMCVRSWECMDAQYTHQIFWFFTLAHIHTPPQRNSHFLFLFCSQHTRDHMQTCSHSHTHTHARIPTPLLAMYHGGLSCCLSNQCMGSFQLHWSEHIIPFPSSPLLNTQIHASHTQTHTHTQSIHSSFYSLTRRDSAPHSKSKRLMCLLGQNEIVCHYKALHYRTPE